MARRAARVAPPVTLGLAPPEHRVDQRRQVQGARGAAAASLAGAAIGAVASVGVTWLVARGMGPAAAGAFFAATASFVLVGGVGKLGAPTSLVYWPARLRARGEPHLLGPCLRIGLAPVGVAGAALGLAMWVAAPWLAALAKGDTAAVATQLRVLAAFLPVAVLADALLSATRGYLAMAPTVLLDRIGRPVLQLAGIGALTIAALWTVVPTGAYPLAWAAPYLPVLVFGGLLLRRVHRAAAGPARPVRRRSAVRLLRREFWRFTGPRALATVAQLALQRVDVLMVAGLAGLPAAALYAVAGRFVVLGQLVNQAISQAVQPRLAEALAAGDLAGARRLYQTATGWLVLATWPLYLGITAFAPLYLGLFGPGYRAGAAIVVVLAGAMLVATGCGMVDMVLAMGGRTSWNLVNVALALAVTVVLDLVLVPHLGALGAAVGLAAAVIVNNLLPLAQVGYALRVHPFGRGTLTAAGLAIACFGVLPLLVTAVTGRGAAGLAASLALGGGGYLAGVAAARRPLALDTLLALRTRT